MLEQLTGASQASAGLDPRRSILDGQRFTMHSARIAGPTGNIFVNPVPIPVHYDQVFATDVQ